MTAAEVLEYTDPRPDTKIGRVRVALMQLYEEHRIASGKKSAEQIRDDNAEHQHGREQV
jgi:hypothetical protein